MVGWWWWWWGRMIRHGSGCDSACGVRCGFGYWQRLPVERLLCHTTKVQQIDKSWTKHDSTTSSESRTAPMRKDLFQYNITIDTLWNPTSMDYWWRHVTTIRDSHTEWPRGTFRLVVQRQQVAAKSCNVGDSSGPVLLLETRDTRFCFRRSTHD